MELNENGKNINISLKLPLKFLKTTSPLAHPDCTEKHFDSHCINNFSNMTKILQSSFPHSQLLLYFRAFCKYLSLILI